MEKKKSGLPEREILLVKEKAKLKRNQKGAVFLLLSGCAEALCEGLSLSEFFVCGKCAKIYTTAQKIEKVAAHTEK